MTRKYVFGALGVAALAIALAPESLAGCGLPKLFADNGAQAASYKYVYLGASSALDFGSIIGRFWQPGSRNSGNEGSYDDSKWLRGFPPPADRFYFTGDLGDGACDGCPSGEMILLLQTKTSDGSGAVFTVGRVPEQFVGGLNYDFSKTNDNWNAIPIPKPRVTSSTRSGTNVIINVSFDNVNSAYHENASNPASADGTGGTIDAYRLLRLTGTADPGRDPLSWTLVQSAPNVAGATLTGVSLDCSDATKDVFLATQLSFDGGPPGGLLSDYVSASTRIVCNQTLAEPKFKLIDKKPKGSPRTRSPR